MPQPPIFSVVIPAAGFSRRMGCPKLLLPWGESTIIETVVRELRKAGIDSIVVVCRHSDSALLEVISKLDVITETPNVDPPEMRTSVELGLKSLEPNWTRDGGWLLIPADHPLVSQGTVRQLVADWEAGKRQIRIPTFEGKRGHPTVFSWDFAAEVEQIPAENGVNWLVRNNAMAMQEIPVDDAGVTADLDTPEDYARFYGQHSPEFR